MSKVEDPPQAPTASVDAVPTKSEPIGEAAKAAPTESPKVAPVAKHWLRRIKFEQVVDVVQLVVLIAGIAIALDQSRKVREAIDTATWSSLASQLTEVDQQFVERPDLVPYFYEGKIIAIDDREYMRAYSLGVLIIDFMDNAVVMGRHVDPEIFEPDRWEKFYKYQFQQSPIICSIIKDEGAIYGEGIVERGELYCPRRKDKGQKRGILPQRPPIPIK